MRRPRYTLEPLVELRDQRVERATRELAGAVAESQAAERGRRAVEQRREVHEESAERVREAERQALDRGELQVADLARADGWEARVAAERRALDDELARAGAAVERARRAEDGARAEVASREAEAHVVHADRDRWQQGEQRRAEAREEEEAAEAYRRRG